MEMVVEITGIEIELEHARYISLVPRPRPKRREKGLGTGERLLGLAGFGCVRRHRQCSNKLESDWLVGSTVTFLRAVSHMTVPKL